MAPATARQRTARSAPQRQIDVRPDLRVVDAGDERAERRSLAGLVGTLSVILLFVGIFGVVVFQVLLVQTQSQLDDLGGTLSSEQALTKDLDLQTANLESPERIVAAAEGLGMIAPDKIVFLEPVASDDPRIAHDPATEPVGIPAPDGTVPVDPATATPPVTPSGPGSGTDASPPAGPSRPPGPPYTAENNWGAGGPPTTPPVYNAENNWGAGPAGTASAGRP